ncbi:hypothetical protein BLOT_015268 [Blomia tropicalis]|nr:hypothetical protein BLOT_015268 [Blomia tropicalis]
MKLFSLLIVLVCTLFHTINCSNELDQTQQPIKSSLSSRLTSLAYTAAGMIPQSIANILPMVFMFGLGALLVPTFGLTSLLRESKRRSLPSFDIGLDTGAFMNSVNEIMYKFDRALNNIEMKYNKA